MRGTKARQRGVLSLLQPWAWKFEWKVLKGEVPTVRAVQEAELSVKIYLSIGANENPQRNWKMHAVTSTRQSGNGEGLGQAEERLQRDSYL